MWRKKRNHNNNKAIRKNTEAEFVRVISDEDVYWHIWDFLFVVLCCVVLFSSSTTSHQFLMTALIDNVFISNAVGNDLQIVSRVTHFFPLFIFIFFYSFSFVSTFSFALSLSLSLSRSFDFSLSRILAYSTSRSFALSLSLSLSHSFHLNFQMRRRYLRQILLNQVSSCTKFLSNE